MAARLVPQKNPQAFVEMARRLTPRYPNAVFAVAGSGKLEGEMLRVAEAAGLGAQFRMLGWREDLSAVHQASDLFVLPSLEEGMSVALLEAMAAGLPVVVTDIPGNRLLVDHDRHGLLVPTEDAEALSAAVTRIFADPDMAARLGVAGRDRVAEEFSLATMARRHYELFESLVYHQGKIS